MQPDEIIAADQRLLHDEAMKHLDALQDIIDQLKALGPHELDGSNALFNTRERLANLGRR
ncbi:hypothetical protein N825_34195 [Skermanella stibiiresistens SB22]|uniref:Uncharacterized protein n=1 Tax=Skermanella stibiiresistens SB22 TaxID=1385369 RepID=W9GPX8_9PROT|nr:hypothetical protein [Skermanella stibiiresistens]EWY35814.1 hypothetical protein N825_34195 [Skermanella stibiiresistens SB22]